MVVYSFLTEFDLMVFKKSFLKLLCGAKLSKPELFNESLFSFLLHFALAAASITAN